MKFLFTILLLFSSLWVISQHTVKVKNGDNAIDFTLKSVEGETIQLSKINEVENVVLIVLRGYPEYQCPICSRQVGQFIAEAEKFEKKNASVLMVYPGASNQLNKYAEEFSSDFNFPDNFNFVLDPDYSMTNKYGLRWDAPKETAYPSTFVINKKGKIIYSKISSTHGGRASTDEVLEALDKP